MGKTGPPGFVGQKGSRGTIGHVVKWNSNDIAIHHPLLNKFKPIYIYIQN